MGVKRDIVENAARPKFSFGRWFNRVVSLIFSVIILLIIIAGILFIRIKSGPIVLPQAQETAARLVNDAVSDFDISFGEVSLVAAPKGINILIQLSDVKVYTKTGQKIAEFPLVRTKINPLGSLHNSIEVEAIEIVGAEFRFLRDANGKFNILPPGNENTEIIKPETIFAAANIAAKKSPLRSLRQVDIIDTNLVYIDQAEKRVWTTTKAQLLSMREGDVITANADVVMSTRDRADTSVGLHFSYGIGDDAFGFGFKFDQASTVDLADQVPALDWLRNFDTTVKGSINTRVKIDGALDRLSGVLEGEKGRLPDSLGALPVEFNHIKTYFEYIKETDSLKFKEITAQSTAGSMVGEAEISMHRDKTGAVDALSGLAELSELEIHPEGIFARPITVDRVKANVHMTISPFSLTLEHGLVQAGDLNITVAGSSNAGDKYWNNAYFARFNEIKYDEVMKYWPLIAARKTRTWVDKNILGGFAKNGIGQFRSRNGKHSVDLKFDIENGKVRYLKTLPVLQEARGRGHLTEKTFKAEVYDGYVIAPNNERIDVSDSEFFVPNIVVKPATGKVTLNAVSSLQAGLSMLDEKPFEFLKKVDLKPTLATGQVVGNGKLWVPLVKGVKPEEVKFQTTAVISDVNSVTLVKNRTLTADMLSVIASDKLVEIQGATKLDGVDTQTKWRMPIGKQNEKQSEIQSHVNLNEKNLRQLGIKFEEGIISGSSPAQVNILLKHKQPPSYVLKSDMVGLGLNIRSLNWLKPKKSKGILLAQGQVGDKVTIDNFSVAASELVATGHIKLDAENKFKQAEFTDLTVGKWLKSAITIDNSGEKRSKITVKSGTADLRNISFAKGAKTGAPMDVVLDRLVLADGIILTDFHADLRNEQGLRGTYSARINHGAEITGSIFPQENGTAAEVIAADAGSVLRSANLYSKGEGGDLRLILTPLEEDGHYRGTFQIKKAKVKQDNILAGLLNGISVIGLVQELAGEGIVFENVDGQFVLKPQGVEVRKTSAIGVSMGITLDGNYNSQTKNVNFEGVITPLYALNGTLERVFGKLFGRQRGEGLFSFIYNVKGASDDPKISVNPLSILAPGVFREIFRSEMPEVGKTEVPRVDNPVEAENVDSGTLTPETDR